MLILREVVNQSSFVTARQHWTSMTQSVDTLTNFDVSNLCSSELRSALTTYLRVRNRFATSPPTLFPPFRNEMEMKV